MDSLGQALVDAAGSVQMLVLLIIGFLFLMMLTIGIIFARMYRRASKETSYVRTGWGGQKVIVNGGALVLPVLHEIIFVNMNTLRLEVRRSDSQALITKDRMRVDVQAEFYVRVQPTEESIANAAQTLGQRTMAPQALADLIEGKFVDALRSVASEMAMEDLHEQRVAFVQKVQSAVSEDLLKNGLELESVSLTGLDQTKLDFFSPQNAFDAEGLTRLTMQIEEKRKQRNDIEQDTAVAIKTKDLGAERLKLDIIRDEEYAKLSQQREIEVRKASQVAEIARERAAKHQEAQQAEISANREVDLSRIAAERVVEEQRIDKERFVRERDIDKAKTVETAEIEQKKTVELSEQDRAIAIAEKSREQSEAQAKADEARAIAVRAEEQVITVREAERADRTKRIELIKASEEAEQEAIGVTVAADAEKKAALDKAEAIRIVAQAESDRERIAAEGSAQAERLSADAKERTFEVDAKGQLSLNEAANVLSVEQIAMQIKLAVVSALPAIIEQSVKPMEQIDGIKIVQVDGLTGHQRAAGAAGAAAASGSSGGAGGGPGNLADEVVRSALSYRAQAPLVDSLLKEVGMAGGSLAELSQGLVASASKGAEPGAAPVSAPSSAPGAAPEPGPEAEA